MLSPSTVLTIQAPAKLNIRLKVTGRRPDGYHDLVSVMVPISLRDTLRFRKGPAGINLTCQGLPVPCDPNNLAFRAAQDFYSRLRVAPGVSIELTKNIPVAAGLGGGSSDAAAVLKALNALYEEPFSEEALAEAAVGIGADVPFFIQSRPCIARGIGDVLEPIEKWPSYWYVVVSPPIAVSTAWAFANLKLELTSGEYDYIVATLGQDCLELSRILENDLEAVTASHYPVIERMKNALLETGAEGALMTGSGPSVFGIFKSEEQAVEAKTYVSSMLLGSVHVATCWEGTAIPS